MKSDSEGWNLPCCKQCDHSNSLSLAFTKCQAAAIEDNLIKQLSVFSLVVSIPPAEDWRIAGLWDGGRQRHRKLVLSPSILTISDVPANNHNTPGCWFINNTHHTTIPPTIRKQSNSFVLQSFISPPQSIYSEAGSGS